MYRMFIDVPSLCGMTQLKNKIQLIGHIGSDPEIRTFNEDRKLARFSVATNDHYTNQEGVKVEVTHWHKIIAWGKLAQICEENVSKGDEVMVTGKLTYRSYADKDQVRRTASEIQAQDIYVFRRN